MKNRRQLIAELTAQEGAWTLKTIEMCRTEAKIDFAWALGLLVLATMLLSITPGLISASWSVVVVREIVIRSIQAFVVAGWMVWCYRYGTMAWTVMLMAYLGFYQRILQLQLEYEAIVVSKPSYWRVFWDDLAVYEEEVRQGANQYRRSM